MTYKITIEQVDEYQEMQTVYEASDGKRYFSTYNIPDTLTYKTKQYTTGAIITKKREIYVQEFVATDLVGIIKAANDIK